MAPNFVHHPLKWHLLSLILLLHPLHLLLVLLPEGLWQTSPSSLWACLFPADGITRIAPHIGFVQVNGLSNTLPIQIYGQNTAVIGVTNVYTQDERQWDHNFLDIKEPNACYLALTSHFPGHYTALHSCAITNKRARNPCMSTMNKFGGEDSNLNGVFPKICRSGQALLPRGPSDALGPSTRTNSYLLSPTRFLPKHNCQRLRHPWKDAEKDEYSSCTWDTKIRKLKPRLFSQAQTYQPTKGSNATLRLGRHCVSPSNINTQALTDALLLAFTTSIPWPVCAFVNWLHKGKP